MKRGWTFEMPYNILVTVLVAAVIFVIFYAIGVLVDEKAEPTGAEDFGILSGTTVLQVYLRTPLAAPAETFGGSVYGTGEMAGDALRKRLDEPACIEWFGETERISPSLECSILQKRTKLFFDAICTRYVLDIVANGRKIELGNYKPEILTDYDGFRSYLFQLWSEPGKSIILGRQRLPLVDGQADLTLICEERYGVVPRE